MTRDDEVNLNLLRNELARCNAELAELREEYRKTQQRLLESDRLVAQKTGELAIRTEQLNRTIPAGWWVRRFQAQMKFCPNGNKTKQERYSHEKYVS